MEEPSYSNHSGSLKSTLLGKPSPRYSPSFRGWSSGRTPRREYRTSGGGIHWFRSQHLVYWLLLITLWAYLGFYFQSRWANGDNGEVFLGFGRKQRTQKSVSEQNQIRDSGVENNSLKVQIGIHTSQTDDDRRIDVILAKKGSGSSKQKTASGRKSKRGARKWRLRSRNGENTDKGVENNDMEEQEQQIPLNNSTYGMLVGPFGSVEDRILEWSPEKRSGTCDRKGDFARLVWSRKFLLVFHELSLTGAPLSMMELATELLSCGATVKVVVLNKRGGLMPELERRRIKVLEDKGELSFKAAMKVDLVIAGSAVCASWIEQYFNYHPAGASQIAWWIMENRREYFDRTKAVLSRVKMLIFLSETQSKQWLTWCEEEQIKLRYMPSLVPLSVNDEMAFVAGFASSLNTPTLSTEKMLEKRQLLRAAVRKEMGLNDNDMLVISLSSINPGKGHLLLLESACSLIEGQLKSGSKTGSIIEIGQQDQEEAIKVLIGSVGSKSNKPDYVRGILSFLSDHSNLSNSVRWTPATTRVASLYSAADVYVINSQGVGETFGRVTIEAMAFGLPVLGTEAGGTKEIVDPNITGLLHPVGRPGVHILAQNLQFMLENEKARKQMGMEGRRKVENMYLKRHMYKRFVDVLIRCMRP